MMSYRVWFALLPMLLATCSTATTSPRTSPPAAPVEQSSRGSGAPNTKTSPLDESGPQPPLFVTAEVMEPLRLAGASRIHLSQSVRDRLRKSGHDKARADLMVCVDESGAVESSVFSAPLGDEAGEDEVIDAIDKWRFRPYIVNGERALVCFKVGFTDELN